MALTILTISERKCNKMEDKLHQNKIFESNFDSFEFDDEFLSKVDSEVKKNNLNLKKSLEVFNGFISKTKNNLVGSIEKDLKKKNYYDLPMSIEDLNESDFKNFSVGGKNKVSFQVSECSTVNKKENSNNLMICLSPIHGEFSSKDRNSSFSSTPLREKNAGEILKEKQVEVIRSSQNVFSGNELEGLELDLFEDWDVDGFNSCETQKNKGSLITLSQAVDLIEEAKLAKESEELSRNDSLNLSINLLTGEVIPPNKGKNSDAVFDDSFDFSKFESVEKKKELNKSVSVSLDCEKGFKKFNESRNKPSAVQKLNFGTKNINDIAGGCGVSSEKQNCGDFENIYLSSDDDFDIPLNFDERDNATKFNAPASKDHFTSNNNINNKTPMRGDSITVELDDSSFHFGKKRKKIFKLLESEVEESPSPKFYRKNMKKTKICDKTSQEVTSGREFIDSEAQVSEDGASSDEGESNKDDEYDKSFVDEESYFTQNYSADMTAKYLQSAKVSNNRPGTFKIPEMTPFNPAEVYSQFLANTSTDYEIDSFCVNDVENEETDLSELEIAEQILEMDRKGRKKKCGVPRSRKKN